MASQPLLRRVKEIASEGHAKAAPGGADAALLGHRDAFDEKIRPDLSTGPMA